jgi:hypothetical protein
MDFDGSRGAPVRPVDDAGQFRTTRAYQTGNAEDFSMTNLKRTSGHSLSIAHIAH